MLGAALARGHATDNPGAVFEHLLGVERALRASEALHDDLGVLVDQNAHLDSFYVRKGRESREDNPKKTALLRALRARRGLVSLRWQRRPLCGHRR